MEFIQVLNGFDATTVEENATPAKPAVAVAPAPKVNSAVLLALAGFCLYILFRPGPHKA